MGVCAFGVCAVVTGRCEIECWVLDHCRWAGFGVWYLWHGGGLTLLGWRIVCRDGFFMDCESGSGAFWARRTPRWVFAGLRERFGEG